MNPPKKRAQRGNNITKCPHCGASCTSLRAKQLAPTTREITYQCSNDGCGFIFIAELSAVRTLAPSDIPNPEVHIPLSATHAVFGQAALRRAGRA